MKKYILLQQDIDEKSNVMLPQGAIPLQVVFDMQSTYVAFLLDDDTYRQLLKTDAEFVQSFVPKAASDIKKG